MLLGSKTDILEQVDFLDVNKMMLTYKIDNIKKVCNRWCMEENIPKY